MIIAAWLEMDELRAEASNLGLNDKIYFTGYLNSKQVQKMYKCADVAVFPSTYEPFGIVALEAMLAGVQQLYQMSEDLTK